MTSQTTSVSTCYECEVCHGLNHYKQFQCHYCNTVPRFYSWMAEPIRIRPDTIMSFSPVETISSTITVHVAFGCERQISRRTIRRIARTVKLDYYAEA